MRKSPFTLVIAAMVLSLPVAAHGQKLVFVVRHAERADTGAPPMQGQNDPPLSTLGQARAAKLAWMLGDSGIKAIFATEFRRTQDTALPLAAKLGLTVHRVPSSDTEGLITTLRKEHTEDIVLVVGHSNTLPAIVKALGGPDVTIADSEYDNLFIVNPGVKTATRIRFVP
jgi:broad specificity phosphatase PhoE